MKLQAPQDKKGNVANPPEILKEETRALPPNLKNPTPDPAGAQGWESVVASTASKAHLVSGALPPPIRPMEAPSQPRGGARNTRTRKLLSAIRRGSQVGGAGTNHRAPSSKYQGQRSSRRQVQWGCSGGDPLESSPPRYGLLGRRPFTKDNTV